MKKNGFVFIESITVLLVVVLSLTLLITSYALVIRKAKENEYYDLPSDKYLLYTIGNLGDTSKDYSTSNSFVANKNNCNTYMSQRISNCSSVFENNGLVQYIVIYGLNNELKNGNPTQKYDSATIEYLKTLKRCGSVDSTCNDDYVVGVFYRDGNYYYVSLSNKKTD